LEVSESVEKPNTMDTLGMDKTATASIGQCWEVATDAFQSRVDANPSSHTLYFVSLMIPAFNTREVSKHFAIYENGYIVDPTFINLAEECVGGSLKFSIYYEEIQSTAKALDIQPYDSKPLLFTPEQFDILMDVVVLTGEIMKGTNKHISLSLIRKSIIALLNVWGEHEAKKKLAAVRVMARLHGVSIQIKPATTPACVG
jgi:hypothetical protein